MLARMVNESIVRSARRQHAILCLPALRAFYPPREGDLLCNSGASNLCCISSVMPKELSEKSSHKLTQLEGRLRSYRGPWKGQLVLVCRKCQKKIKHSGTKNKLGKLSKTLKKRARRQEGGAVIDTVGVSCLGMCPKGGITVC